MIITREVSSELTARGFEPLHKSAEIGDFERLGIPLVLSLCPDGTRHSRGVVFAPTWALRLVNEWEWDAAPNSRSDLEITIALLRERSDAAELVDAVLTCHELGGLLAVERLLGLREVEAVAVS